jgi:hypothetical protein
MNVLRLYYRTDMVFQGNPAKEIGTVMLNIRSCQSINNSYSAIRWSGGVSSRQR